MSKPDRHGNVLAQEGCTVYDFTWAVGLFEGEGHIGVHRIQGSDRCKLELRVTMSDEDIVRRFAVAINHPGTVDGPWEYKNSIKPLWTWHARGTALRKAALVERMLPWLGERRRQQGYRLQAYAWLREGQPIRRGRDGNCPATERHVHRLRNSRRGRHQRQGERIMTAPSEVQLAQELEYYIGRVPTEDEINACRDWLSNSPIGDLAEYVDAMKAIGEL